MPIGPSHSHSSGGGFSSRGGGGFSSRSHGSSFGGMHFGPRNFVFFGRTIVVGGGSGALSAILIFFLVISIMVSIVFGSIKSDAKESLAENQEYLEIMKSDNNYYKNMLEMASADDAEEKGYYTTTATFKKNMINYEYYENTLSGAYYFDDYNRVSLFYIVYNYKSEYDKHGNKITEVSEKINLKGETYAQYSLNQVNGKGGEIEIVYHYDENEARWVSINKDYPLDLEHNLEYKLLMQYISDSQSEIKSSSTVLTSAIIVVVVLIICLVLTFIYIFKKSKKQAELEEQKKQAEIDEAKAKASEAEANAFKKNRVCVYCGNSVPDNETKCPACGSSKFKKKSKV